MARWALVTGASRGIGAEIARQAAADGCDLVLAARSAAELEALAAELRARHAVRVHVVPIDLAGRDAADALAAELERVAIVPDLLINNAGIGAYGLHRELPLAAEQEILDLNVVTLTRLTKRLLPGMLARGSGDILQVASVAAFVPGPRMAVYYASKAYVLSYSEALAEELAGTGVRVTVLCPGPTRTGFQARAGLDPTAAAAVRAADAADVARIGYRALQRGRRVVVAGSLNRLLVGSIRLLPRRLVTALLARLNADR